MGFVSADGGGRTSFWGVKEIPVPILLGGRDPTLDPAGEDGLEEGGNGPKPPYPEPPADVRSREAWMRFASSICAAREEPKTSIWSSPVESHELHSDDKSSTSSERNSILVVGEN